MLSAPFTMHDNSSDSSPSRFIPNLPPRKKRRLTEQSDYVSNNTNNSNIDSPQFVLKNIDGEFKLVVADENNDDNKMQQTECINLLTDNENDRSNAQKNKNKEKNKKRKYIDLCLSDNTKKPESINLITSDSNDELTKKLNTKSVVNDNDDKQCQFHAFLNKPTMSDAADSIYQFFKEIINKYKDNNDILSKIEIEGRIGMLLKKKPPKNNKHRNNRYLRVSDDVFSSNNNHRDTVKVYKTKQKGFKFDADVKKQTFYYFKTVMNGLYVNASILNKNERLNINSNISYPSITYKSVNKMVKKYNHGIRSIEYITDKIEINNICKRGQKERIANLDICFNFDESDYDIRINAAIERDENEIKRQPLNTVNTLNEDVDINNIDHFNYRELRVIRCKECIEYKYDSILKIEISTVHTYCNNLLDGRFIQTLRENLYSRDKLPMTSDCKQREYLIEIEIINFKQFALSTNRELKRLSVWFSNTCLQIAKLLGYVNDFAKKNNKLPQLSQFDIDKINKQIAENQIVPLYQNPYYKNHHYHNVIHKQVIHQNDNKKKKKNSKTYQKRI